MALFWLLLRRKGSERMEVFLKSSTSRSFVNFSRLFSDLCFCWRHWNWNCFGERRSISLIGKNLLWLSNRCRHSAVNLINHVKGWPLQVREVLSLFSRFDSNWLDIVKFKRLKFSFPLDCKPAICEVFFDWWFSTWLELKEISALSKQLGWCEKWIAIRIARKGHNRIFGV